MAVSYAKLFKLMVEKKMRRGDLKDRAGISYATIAKMENGENVYMDVVVKVCKAMDCTVDDIMEITPDENSNQNAIATK